MFAGCLQIFTISVSSVENQSILDTSVATLACASLLMADDIGAFRRPDVAGARVARACGGGGEGGGAVLGCTMEGSLTTSAPSVPWRKGEAAATVFTVVIETAGRHAYEDEAGESFREREIVCVCLSASAATRERLI
jgi:hypothetical protein